MNLVNNFMICDKCKREFDRNNYPVTLSCGHSLCQRCVSSQNMNKFVCEIDDIKQDIKNNPSIEYLNLLEAVKTIPDLYKPVKFTEASKPYYQKTFNINAQSKNRVVCKFHLKGNCRFGHNCWNLH